jgi:predicted ATPase/DNA-binding CsgD family transcriptional regulator/transcriptional regulator with XRE-family HTH domain
MNTIEPAPFGELLRYHRAKARLTQEQLAARAGVSAVTIAALEHGRRRAPRSATVDLLASALQLSHAERAAFDTAARPLGAITAADLAADGWNGDKRADKTPGPHIRWLSVYPTPLVDRSHEVKTILRMLNEDGVRLLTLVGPAGVGKTRLALAAAQYLEARGSDRFSDGVTLVDLTPVRDPALALSAIMYAQGLQEISGQSPLERLAEALRDQQLLLVLDNVEQILPAGAPHFAQLLAACPTLTLLVTSRVPLQLHAEQTFRIAPLPVPDLSEPLPPLDTLTAIPSVELFMQQARARQPNFNFSDQHAPLLARLTSQLDGLPLALELAAARTATLPLQVIVRRLGDRLRLLRWEAADAPTRQQSLEAAVGWSFELLNDNERRLFSCLGVFTGRISLNAIVAVVSDTDGQVGEESALETLASLVDKSLVQALGPESMEDQSEEDHLEPSFTMLETVREYAEEQLISRGVVEAARRAHAHYFLALAEQADSHLRGHGQRLWYLRLERERDNLRTALRWLLDQDKGAEREAALRLAGALGLFWVLRGYHAEGLSRLDEALTKAPLADMAARTRALTYAGLILMHQRSLVRAQDMLEGALALAEERGDSLAAVEALTYLGGRALYARDMAESGRLLHEALLRGQELEDPFALGSTLFWLGVRALEVGNVAEAATLEEEALERFSRGGDLRAAGGVHGSLAVIYGQIDDLARGVQHVRAELQIALDLQDRWLLRIGARAVLTLTGGQADPARQAQLLGAVERQTAQPDSAGMGAYERWTADRGMSKLTQQLGQSDWDVAFRAGRALRFDEVAALALTLTDEMAQLPLQPEIGAASNVARSAARPLTARELEVLRLVAAGLSSKLIARELGITPSTVNYHLATIFNKLAVDTRAQAVAVAAQRGLL